MISRLHSAPRLQLRSQYSFEFTLGSGNNTEFLVQCYDKNLPRNLCNDSFCPRLKRMFVLWGLHRYVMISVWHVLAKIFCCLISKDSSNIVSYLFPFPELCRHHLERTSFSNNLIKLSMESSKITQRLVHLKYLSSSKCFIVSPYIVPLLLR